MTRATLPGGPFSAFLILTNHLNLRYAQYAPVMFCSFAPEFQDWSKSVSVTGAEGKKRFLIVALFRSH